MLNEPTLHEPRDLDTDVDEDKYNSDLHVTNLYTKFRNTNVMRSKYIELFHYSSKSNDVTTLLTLNIRSIPTNVQSFVDTVLGSVATKYNILGLTELRLEAHLSSLYQLPGYSLFTNCRNTHGGGVAMYISDC